MRSDFLRKDGGDIVQIREYARRLEGWGYQVELVPFSLDLDFSTYDIVHAVNVDRVYDFLWALSRAKGKPFFVSPIHHDFTRVARMRADGRGRVRLPESFREAGALIWRSRRQGAGWLSIIKAVAWLCRTGIAVRRRVGVGLDAANAVFLLAEGEGDGLVDDFGWKRRNAVLTPNGMPDASDGVLEWAERAGVLVVGRIEPRKRSLDLLRALPPKNALLVDFVGAPGRQGGYFKLFVTEVEQTSGARYCGSLTHSEVVELLSRCRVLLNASWVEVQSLVELEAARCGAWVVGFESGNTAEFLPSRIDVKGWEMSSLLEAGMDALQQPAPPPLNYPYSWGSSARSIADAYELVGA